MKRKFKKLFCAILTLILCINITTPTTAASNAKYKAAVSKYQKFLKDNKGTYNIVDLDENGIPELVIHNMSNGSNEVYTYNASSKKMICLRRVAMGKGYGMPVKFSTAKHQVMMPHADTGGSIIWIYKIKGQKSLKVLKAEYINGKFENISTKYKRGYIINGKRVSERTYNKKLNNMTRGFRNLTKTSK